MVTLEEFVNRILEDGQIAVPYGTGMEYGVRKGWLEAQDAAGKFLQLNRKTAARIIHNFLRFEQREPDEIDASPAYVLKDLFDCRVCAGHIIQVYVKGIMDAEEDTQGNPLFCADNFIPEEEEAKIRERIFLREKRRKMSPTPWMCGKEPEQISGEQMKRMAEREGAVIADVRTGREFEKDHLPGAINIPLLDILKNPYTVPAEMGDTIVCCCEEGVQAAAAARCLLEAGYRNACFMVYKIN